MSVVAWARPVFPSLSPRYLEIHSPCGHLTLLMTRIIIHFTDLAIDQRVLPQAENICRDKVPAQNVNAYLGTWVAWYQQQHWHDPFLICILAMVMARVDSVTYPQAPHSTLSTCPAVN